MRRICECWLQIVRIVKLASIDWEASERRAGIELTRAVRSFPLRPFAAEPEVIERAPLFAALRGPWALRSNAV